MSYAHYWTRTDAELEPAIFERIGHNLKVLIAASPVKLCGGYGEEGTPPRITDEEIWFNGTGTKETGAYEDFVLARDPSQRFERCATAGMSGVPKPYDHMVKAALIVADNIAPGAWEIRSDGWDFQWGEALSFVNRHLPGGYELPAPVARNAGLDTDHYAEARREWLRERNRAA